MQSAPNVTTPKNLRAPSWAELKNVQLTLSKLLRELFLLVLPGSFFVDFNKLLHLFDQVGRAELSRMEASMTVSDGVNAVDCVSFELFMYHYLKRDNCVSMFISKRYFYQVKRYTYAIFLLV